MSDELIKILHSRINDIDRWRNSADGLFNDLARRIEKLETGKTIENITKKKVGTFDWALPLIREGKEVTRFNWKKTFILGKDKSCHECDNVLSIEDILADDWLVVK